MKTILAGIVATLIVATVASFILGSVQEPVADRYTAATSVRLSN